MLVSDSPKRGGQAVALIRTYHEPIYSAAVCTGAPLMPEIIADPPLIAAITCFPGLKSRNLNNLILIFCGLARATRAGASRREAPVTRAAGRPGFPIRGAGCPISRPGR